MFDVFYLNQPTKLFAHERPADSIDHARALSRTRYLWIIDAHNDYSGHDWLWEPRPWQSDQAHVWPSQHQANGGTWLVPKTQYNHVNRDHELVTRSKSAPIVGIDHGNGLNVPCMISTRYISDYLGTMRRILSKVDHNYVWIVSSICDYSQFDFTWHASEWQSEMLHVFASDEQQFGDTFYVHVPSFLKQSRDLTLLEWYDTLHFVPSIGIPRRTTPVIQHCEDTHVAQIKNYQGSDPLVIFSVQPPTHLPIPAINLWREHTKTVTPLDKSASRVIVPRNAIPYIRGQVYDYPWIDRSFQDQYQCDPQDIVFISYDEPQAESNWQHLYERFPRARRVHGVAGMEHALVAAAKTSSTPWFYAVFAKTELASQFDFTFAPDYLQIPKHYIFDCLNTVNGLRYGHMGVVLYNVKYVLEERPYCDLDLDYTLSFPHEVVPNLSCYGRFDSSGYHTWRTAFRECTKLSLYHDREPSVDTEYRLSVWTNQATGKFAEWCLRGARDGVEFYQECNADLDKIKHSFNWQWLRARFISRYGDDID